MKLIVALSASVFAFQVSADVSVPFKPSLLTDADVSVEGSSAALEVNLPLARRVALDAEDIRDTTISVICEAPSARIDVLACGKTVEKNGRIDLGKETGLKAFRLCRGERIVLTAWKSSWHWNGRATLSDGRLSCGRTSVALPGPGASGDTPLGRFEFSGFARRDDFPKLRGCEKAVADGSGAVKVAGANGVSIGGKTGELVFRTNGRSSFDKANDWAPAVVFTAAEEGTYRLEGVLTCSAEGKDPEVRWIVGRLLDAAPSLDGVTLSLCRLVKAVRGIPDETCVDPVPLARATLKGRKQKVTFSGLAPAMRKWLSGDWKDFGVCVRATRSDGSAAAVTVSRDSGGSLSIVEHPKHLLFDAPLKIKPGVYAEMRDGRLYYDGRRLRLWSMVKDGNGARYRQLGMNGWRSWFAEDFYSPESAKLGEAMSFTKGDDSKLDRFDARFASMKENDVFVMFATLVGLGMDMKQVTSEGSWLHALHGKDPDWNEWQKAVLEIGGNAYIASYFDDRLWEVRLRHAQNVLTHRNPYTGKTYAEDEAIVLMEINNEAMHVKKWVENGFEKYPAFFRAEIEGRWREYAAKTPGATRQRFYMDLVDDRNRDYIAHCRRFAPRGVGVNKVAFSCDSMYRPSIPWLWANAQGDSSTVSMYFWQNGTMLASPPGLYVIDSHRLDGKLNVIYETGRGRPCRFRAETPYSLAVFCSWQDFDIVDWHGSWTGDAPAEAALVGTAMPPETSHYWNAVHLESDPVMTSAIAMAGRLYLSGVIGEADDPAIYSLGRDAVYGRDAWNGVGGADMSRLAFTRGAKLRFDLAQKESVLVDGKAPERVPLPEGPVRTGRYAVWDWQNERLIVDAPGAKVYVGKACPSYAFSDGIVLSGVNVPWIAFSIISRDGKPLAESSESAWVNAVANAQNSGFAYDEGVAGGPLEQAKAVKNRGHAPVVVDPVAYTLSFPRQSDLKYSAYDFALRETGRRAIRGGNVLRMQAQTDWMGIVSFGTRGAAAAAVVDPSPGVAKGAVARQLSAASQERTDPSRNGYWSPLPDVSWGDSLLRAYRSLCDSSIPHGAVTRADTTAAGQAIRVREAVFLMKMPATVELRYDGGRLQAMEVEFEQAPAFCDLVAELESHLGSPQRRNLTENAFEQSEVVWVVDGAAGKMSAKATETQGVVRLSMNMGK